MSGRPVASHRDQIRYGDPIDLGELMMETPDRRPTTQPIAASLRSTRRRWTRSNTLLHRYPVHQPGASCW